DKATYQTNMRGVFAGGDCVRGPSSVIAAIADGKKAAASIDRFLSGGDAFLSADPPSSVVDKDQVLLRSGNVPRQWRPSLQILSPDVRRKTFREYTRTLSAEEAVREASRCLACGCGAGCEICVKICKMFAWETNAQGQVSIDEDKCVACGMCIFRCPSRNIDMVQTSDTPI
ncbi:MAG: 4Fe-4S binding protein, partial [Kiritimatiellae bacterium]|nr:4Fe-4S binding protein [Kiritimatiellia bacterium]